MLITSHPTPPRKDAAERSRADQPDHPRRRHRLLESVSPASAGLDAVVVCETKDILYLTGAGEGLSWFVVANRSGFGISRHMLIRQAREAAPDCEILLTCKRSTERPDVELFLVTELARRGFRVVGIDPSRILADSYLRFIRHADAAGIGVVPVTGSVAALRAVKDSMEIERTRRCVAIAESAFRGLIEAGAASVVGRTEREISIELEARMLALGADRQGFPETGLIVASGPHSSSAHHTPGLRRVAVGEPLLIDWGAELSGYRSDLTRTLFPGHPPDFAIQAYPVVEKAQRDAAAKLRPGSTMGEADFAARQAITAAGYPEFDYGVGHGVGLDIHEAPWLRANSEEILETDMITTIEPGIYLGEAGGIRIENIYRIAPQGNERMGDLPATLESMVLV
jgi:Xaa-Pro aminopeptidase